jgi:hypothetical protein
MNYLEKYFDFDTLEEGEKQLEKALEIRDSMGGQLYWSACNDDCIEISKKLQTFKDSKTKKQWEESGYLNGLKNTKKDYSFFEPNNSQVLTDTLPVVK